MIENSFFYGLFSRFGERASHYFKHSLIGRFFAWVLGMFKESKFFAAVAAEGRVERGFEGSFFGRLLRNPSMSKYTAPHIERSWVLSTVSGICGSLPYVSLRSFGIMVLLMGGIPAGMGFLVDGYTSWVFLAIVALSVPLLLLNRSFAQLHRGSWVLQKGLGFFYITHENYDEREKKYYLPVFVLLGAAIGAAAHLFGLMGLVLASGGIIGGVLVLWRVEFGIFAAAFFAPILPTMLIIALVAGTIGSFAIKVLFTGGIKMKFGYTDVFVLLFMGIMAYGLVVSYHFASTLPALLVYLLFVTFYFVVKNTLDTKEKLLAAAAVIATSGLFVALFGIWQRVTGNFTMTEAWLDMDMFGAATVRIYSTLDNPNVLGSFLIFIVILAFAMLYYYKDFLHKFMALGIFAAASLCLVLTHSRGAWLGMLLAAGLFALMRDRRLVGLGILALMAAPFIIPPEIIYRFLSIGDMTDTSTSFRMSIYLGAIDMLRVFWPIGIGQGVENFNYIYNMFAFSAVFTQHAHNLYLQIMIYWGIGGIFTFFAVLGGFFKGLFKKVACSPVEHRTLAAALAAGMAGFLLMGLTDNVWYNFRMVGFFWLIMAVGAALSNIETEVECYDQKTGKI
ncbi:MAG: O-antigen ligase family protein [Defluviitaleaceae bacterium]|nr:O-antigen ligase family protein [Defluviitaleaceae bacterium]